MISYPASGNPNINPTITGGTIDNTVIGGAVRSTGAFTYEWVGASASANSTRFPNAIGVFSNTAAGIQINETHNIGLIAEGTASATDNTVYGIGLYGVGYTSAITRCGGIVGEGHVSASTDIGSAVGVRGYALDTHAGGANIGLYGNASGGATNYALYMFAGDIYSSAAQTWWLNGNVTFSGAYTVTMPTLGLAGSTSGSIAVKATAIAGSNTATFPAVTGTVQVISASGTFATMQTVTGQYIGQQYFCTDVGVNGVSYTWNGTKWIHESPIDALQAGIPFVLANGTGTSNAITVTNTAGAAVLSTISAMPNTYSVANTGGAYIYLPANAVGTGQAAGFYYFIATSTTGGTVYNNMYAGGQPTIPASPAAFGTVTTGTFLQTVGSAITALSLPLQANLLGANGFIEINGLFVDMNSAQAKTAMIYLGSGQILSASQTTAQSACICRKITNQTTKTQITATTSAWSDANGFSSTGQRLAIDTTAAQNLTLQLQLAAAATNADVAVYEYANIRIQPS
jgi:hypothetical protein